MTAKRFYMDKNGDLYDKENGLLMLDFGYSYDGVNCKRIIDLLNEQHEEIGRLKRKMEKVYNSLVDENEQLKFENNELKCALALDEVDYIIADGKKIDIPPYYEFEQRYDSVMHRREYDGYD